MVFRKLQSDDERFWSKVNKDGPIPDVDPNLGPCWLWLGSNIRGYGQFSIGSHTNQSRKTIKAHRFAYERLIGPIPEGLQIDHLCNNPTCVNPAHMNPTTARENLLRNSSPVAENARKEFCPRGHPLTIRANGTRACRICMSEAQAEYRKRNPDKVKAYEQSHRQQAAARQAAYRARKKNRAP